MCRHEIKMWCSRFENGILTTDVLPGWRGNFATSRRKRHSTKHAQKCGCDASIKPVRRHWTSVVTQPMLSGLIGSESHAAANAATTSSVDTTTCPRRGTLNDMAGPPCDACPERDTRSVRSTPENPRPRGAEPLTHRPCHGCGAAPTTSCDVRPDRHDRWRRSPIMKHRLRRHRRGDPRRCEYSKDDALSSASVAC